MEISVLGIDLAKNIFHMIGINERGAEVYRNKLSRKDVLRELSQVRCGKVAMEACSGAHYWARELVKVGHKVVVLPAQHVKAYVKSNKNDWRDAAAIAEAASRDTIKSVSAKSLFQQDLQCLHRVRARLVKARTALCNEIRGFLAEYGVVIARGKRELDKHLLETLEAEEQKLTTASKELFLDLAEELRELNKKIALLEKRIHRHSQGSECYERLMEIEGVGFLTASAVVAAVSTPSDYKNGRHFSAWLGLVPRQHSSGGVPRLLGISKRGDSYLRSLLIQGARVAARYAKTKSDPRSHWITELSTRRGSHKAAVALANKNARTIWAMLAYGTRYNPEQLAA